MKKLWTRFVMLTSILVLMLSFGASAAEPYFQKNMTFEYEKNGANGWTIGGQNVPSTAKIKNLKCSNTKIAALHRSSYTSGDDATVYPSFDMKIKRAGKCTISFDLAYGNETRHFTIRVKVKNYVSPVKSLKINGKSFTSKTNGSSRITKKIKNGQKYRFDIKTKPGWVVDKIEVYGGNKDRIYKKAREFKLYKSDRWVAIGFRTKDRSKYSYVYIDLK